MAGSLIRSLALVHRCWGFLFAGVGLKNTGLCGVDTSSCFPTVYPILMMEIVARKDEFGLK